MSWIETFAYTLSRKNREKKFRFFMDTVKPKPEETILDIGVNGTEYSESDNYLEKHYDHPEKITAVSKDPVTEFSARYPAVTSLQADGRKLPFQNDQFDIGYSNAVIEHVGTHEDQLAFLRESFRVAKRGYFTTPNRHFPIEIHTRVPLLHLILPKKHFDAFLRFMGKGWATGDYMHLLSLAELKHLLKKSGIRTFHIRKNRFLGLTMTFTVIWEK